MRYFILLSLTMMLYGSEKFILISNKNFPVKHLLKGQVKQIYLKRVKFIEDMPIIPINYISRDALRQNFEKKILRMSDKKLSKYWMRKHYLGIRPPIVQSSLESAIIFVKRVDGAIAYIPFSKLPKDVQILYTSKERQ